MRRSLLLVCLTVLGCDPNAGDPSVVGRVEQRTVEGGFADAVYGQPNLFVGTEPPEVTQDSSHYPAAVATDVAPPPGASAIVWIADRNAHRVLGFDPISSPKIAWWVLGQLSWTENAPNGGGAVSAATMFSPTALAYWRNANLLAVADAGNHRVLFGVPTSGIPWSVSTVFGQKGAFDTNEPNKGGAIAADTLNDPGGVAIDPLENGRLFVADTGNHRVLLFAPLLPDSGKPVNTSAGLCLGQDDCTTGLPNRGGAVSRDSLNEPRGMATYNVVGDSLRGLYVADTGNHRVLHYPLFSSKPDLVYGQHDDFTTAIPSKGGPSARSLRSPTGVAVDRDGALWIADTGHHRVLHFPKGRTVADRVLGQPNLTTAAPPTLTDASHLRAPEGVAVTATDVFVADTGFSRVLRFNRGCDLALCDDANLCTVDSCSTAGCQNLITTFPPECRGNRCTKNECTPCSTTAPCQAGYQCLDGLCAIRCVNDATCPGGTCVDGYCCDRRCDGPCESCNQPGAYGRCTPVREGAPPKGKTCGTTADCGGQCNGSDGARCYQARAGVECGVEACVDGVARGRGVCRADGSCTGATTSCAPYGCDIAGCRTTCRWDFECADGASCVSGVCAAGYGIAPSGGCALSHPGSQDLTLIALASALALVWRRRR